ncbi:MAG: tRNA lysidine(34) synthetase TilS [Thermotogae bacterium]|nr:tRNA lysidine(34) synthetase TilS [Thermotogota bacterium]
MLTGPVGTPVNLSKLDRVKEAIERFSLLKEGERVAVALSGGADSVFCLLSLLKLKYRIIAVHINHGLRKTADRDENFVRKLCTLLNVPLEVKRIKVPSSGSLEEMARIARYRALKETANRHGVSKVCLAHTLSDAYETALFNLSRGTGIFGLVLPPRSGIFVRPLILLWREEIRKDLKRAGVSWVEDESNLDTRFARNFIRLNVLPHMLELFPDLPSRFSRTYSLLVRESQFIKDLINRYGRENLLTWAGMSFLLREDDYLALRFLSKRLNLEPSKLEPIFGIRPGSVYRANAYTFHVYGSFVAYYREIPRLSVQRRRFVWEDLNLKLVGQGLKDIVVRPRRMGERIGKIRLKKLYDRVKMPSFLRDLHPVVERKGKIVWIPGIYGHPKGFNFVKICPRRPNQFDVYRFIGVKLKAPTLE